MTFLKGQGYNKLYLGLIIIIIIIIIIINNGTGLWRFGIDDEQIN